MPLHIKIDDVWKTVTPWIKVGGVWKKLTKGFVKVGGAWQEAYPNIVYHDPVTFGDATPGLNKTFAIPEGGYTIMRLRVVGGGGGGGGASGAVGGGGGGGGGGAMKTFTIQPSDAGRLLRYSIASMANGGAVGSEGGWGNNTSINSNSQSLGGSVWSISANGGGPGPLGSGGGGAGGTCSSTGTTLDVNQTGGAGGGSAGGSIGGSAGNSGGVLQGWNTAYYGNGGKGGNGSAAGDTGYGGYIEFYFAQG